MKYAIILGLLAAHLSHADDLPNCDQARKSSGDVKMSALMRVLDEHKVLLSEIDKHNQDVTEYQKKMSTGEAENSESKLKEFKEHLAALKARDQVLRNLTDCLQKG